MTSFTNVTQRIYKEGINTAILYAARYKKLYYYLSAVILAIYIDNRYLDTKDSDLVQIVTCDVAHYLKDADIDSVLVFPPVESYFRLLIHKTIEESFPHLCSFSVGEGDERRTVVCLQDSILRATLYPCDTFLEIPDAIQKVRRTVAMSQQQWDKSGWYDDPSRDPQQQQTRPKMGRGRGRGRAKKFMEGVCSDDSSKPGRRMYSDRGGMYSDRYDDNKALSLEDSPSEQNDIQTEKKDRERVTRMRPRRAPMQVYVPRARRQQDQTSGVDGNQPEHLTHRVSGNQSTHSATSSGHRITGNQHKHSATSGGHRITGNQPEQHSATNSSVVDQSAGSTPVSKQSKSHNEREGGDSKHSKYIKEMDHESRGHEALQKNVDLGQETWEEEEMFYSQEVVGNLKTNVQASKATNQGDGEHKKKHRTHDVAAIGNRDRHRERAGVEGESRSHRHKKHRSKDREPKGEESLNLEEVEHSKRHKHRRKKRKEEGAEGATTGEGNNGEAVLGVGHVTAGIHGNVSEPNHQLGVGHVTAGIHGNVSKPNHYQSGTGGKGVCRTDQQMSDIGGPCDIRSSEKDVLIPEMRFEIGRNDLNLGHGEWCEADHEDGGTEDEDKFYDCDAFDDVGMPGSQHQQQKECSDLVVGSVAENQASTKSSIVDRESSNQIFTSQKPLCSMAPSSRDVHHQSVVLQKDEGIHSITHCRDTDDLTNGGADHVTEDRGENYSNNSSLKCEEEMLVEPCQVKTKSSKGIGIVNIPNPIAASSISEDHALDSKSMVLDVNTIDCKNVEDIERMEETADQSEAVLSCSQDSMVRDENKVCTAVYTGEKQVTEIEMEIEHDQTRVTAKTEPANTDSGKFDAFTNSEQIMAITNKNTGSGLGDVCTPNDLEECQSGQKCKKTSDIDGISPVCVDIVTDDRTEGSGSSTMISVQTSDESVASQTTYNLNQIVPQIDRASDNSVPKAMDTRESVSHAASQMLSHTGDKDMNSIDTKTVRSNEGSEAVAMAISEVTRPNDNVVSVVSQDADCTREIVVITGAQEDSPDAVTMTTGQAVLQVGDEGVSQSSVKKKEATVSADAGAAVEVEEEEDEDSWDKMFDDDGEALEPKLMEELTVAVGKVKVTKPQFDYLDYQPKDPDMDYDDYRHLIEIHDFPAELVTRDLVIAFQEFKDKGFDIKWVDDHHAIGVFSSTIAANSALSLKHPLMKVRPISLASRQTKLKAKRTTEFLQPYKPRPETVASVARNLVAGALGLKSNIPKEKRDEERRKLKEARELKRNSKKQKEQAWDGSFGKCAMDDV